MKKLVFSIVVVSLCISALVVAPRGADASGSATYTALGDSLAFGAFAPIGAGYVPLYEKAIEKDTGTSVQLVNLGIPGWQSSDLRNATHSRPLFRLSIALSSVVTWNIGGNDLNAARNLYKAGTCGGQFNQNCLATAVTSFKSNWDGILVDIFALRHGRPTVLRTMTVYNPFVEEDLGKDTWPGDGVNDFQALKPYLDQVNDYIIKTSSTAGILVADVYGNFNPGDQPVDPSLISFDGFHPNGNGHALMAGLLRKLGYGAIVP